MNLATYRRLAKNPHYKLSKKQEAEAMQENIDIHTQQLDPEDMQLITFKGKRDVKPSRSPVSTKKNDKKTQ